MLTASQIFLQAQAAWISRAIPAYESFQIPCEKTDFFASCKPGALLQVIIRLRDGRGYVATLPNDGSAPLVLLRGGYITGPAGAPLGFYRSAPTSYGQVVTPPNFASDPLAKTIATVTTVDRSYDITLLADETVDGRLCYHLALKPLRDPATHQLRELWVDQSSFEVVRLTYQQPFNNDPKPATVHYDFAPVGPQALWTIVHIDAQAVVPRGLLSSQTQSIAEDLEGIAFPASVPDADFTS